jgi:hypothetical protein
MWLFKKTKQIDKEVLKYSKDSYCIKDNYKNKDYFLRQLEEVNKRIDKYKTLFDNGEVKDENVYYIFLSSRLLEKIGLLNTLGEDKENIKSLVEEYCDAVEKKSDNLLTYNEVKNTLSLAYLYNLDIDKVKFVKENMPKDTWIDASLDMLINGMFLNKPITSKNFCFKLTLSGNLKKTDGEFMNVVNAKNQVEINDAFVEYLKTTKESFYKRQLKEYEGLDEDRYTYTGSCDFMLTALAKMLKIDKNLLEDSKFIDIDLV